MFGGCLGALMRIYIDYLPVKNSDKDKFLIFFENVSTVVWLLLRLSSVMPCVVWLYLQQCFAYIHKFLYAIFVLPVVNFASAY